MKLVVWSKASSDSLQYIYDYILNEGKSPQNAEMVVLTLLELGNELNIFPEKFPKEPTFKDESIRFCVKWNFKISYQIKNDKILIINIYSTKMSFFK
ncbi:MAG: type II toxin-antitoxin system RelE/ParE family toxin [Flavobacterium macrobrachii]